MGYVSQNSSLTKISQPVSRMTMGDILNFAVAELLPLGKRRCDELAATGAVLQRMEIDRHLVARLQRIGLPAGWPQLANRLHLE